MPLLVGALLPTDDVTGRLEFEGARLAELVAQTLLDLGAEVAESAILDRVLEAGAFAAVAIAPVALHGDDLLGNVDRLLRRAEAHHISGAREGVDLAVRHAHAATDGDVPADQLALLVGDGDIAQVVRVDVDVVRRRHGDDGLELTREVVDAVDRLLVLLGRSTLVDHLLTVEPDLVIGAGLRQ